MANLSKIKLNGVEYNLKDAEARTIYIDIIPTEDGFVAANNLTYAQLKEMTENKNNPICLRYEGKRWYLTSSEMIEAAIVDEAVVGEAVLSE